MPDDGKARKQHDQFIGGQNSAGALETPQTRPASELAQAAGEQSERIATTLKGVAGMDLVSLESDGHRSLQPAAEYTAEEIRELVNVLCGGDAVAFLSDYIKVAEPEERAALELALGKGDG